MLALDVMNGTAFSKEIGKNAELVQNTCHACQNVSKIMSLSKLLLKPDTVLTPNKTEMNA